MDINSDWETTSNTIRENIKTLGDEVQGYKLEKHKP
jgi:hypothetical protein